MFFTQNAWAEKAIGNYPVKGSEVVLGFNVPQTGAYADEGADELRAYKLAVKHLNNSGGMLDTLKPSKLNGNGILGKTVTYVTGDTQTNADASRTSARRMIERDKVIMVTGGSSSGIAIAQQYLCNEILTWWAYMVKLHKQLTSAQSTSQHERASFAACAYGLGQFF